MQAQPTTEIPELRELHEHCTRIHQLLAAGHANCHEIGMRCQRLQMTCTYAELCERHAPS